MENQIHNNASVTNSDNEKMEHGSVFRGLLYSFLVYLGTFVITPVLGIFAVFFLTYVSFLGGILTLVLLTIVAQILPFVIINTLILLATKKIKVKKGVQIGYLFIVLMLLNPLSQIHQVSTNAIRQKSLDATTLNGVALDCKNLPDIYAQDECISKIAIDERDPSLCNEIKVETISLSPATRILKDNCYNMVLGVAVEKGDVSYCDKITDNSSLFSDCKLVALAVANGDYSCSQVKKNFNLSDYCTKGVPKNVDYQKMVSQGVWKTYNWNSYTFSYPPDWVVDEVKSNGYSNSSLYFKPFSGSSDGFISVDIARCGPNVPGKCVYYHNTMTIYTPSQDETILKVFDQFVQKIK